MTPNPGIHILGVNQVGQEAGNDLMCDGRNLPWLQETMTELAWTPWHVVYRDVIILDGQNRQAAVFNLLQYNLAVTANYDSLRTLLLDLAE